MSRLFLLYTLTLFYHLLWEKMLSSSSEIAHLFKFKAISVKEKKMDSGGATNSEWTPVVLYLVGGAPTGPARGFPGPLLGDAVDVVASPWGRVRVLLPQVHDLKRLLTCGRARRLRLQQTFLWLYVSVKRGVLPGQLGQIGLCWDLVGRKSKGGKEKERQEKKRSREGGKSRGGHGGKRNETWILK